MKAMHISIMSIFAAALFAGCGSEIPEGSLDEFNAMPTKAEVYAQQDQQMIKRDFLPLKHPCMLHTDADFARIRQNLSVAPWSDAFAHLEQSSYAQASYSDNTHMLGADGKLKRMDANNWSGTYPDYNNYTGAMRDAAAAYQLALRYQISGDDQYAATAVKVLNAWKDKCTGVLKLPGYNDSIPDPNIYLCMIQGHQFANAAELLRNYSGWQAKDFNEFKQWMKMTFSDLSIQFLRNHQGGQGSMHAWLNWDLAAMTTVLSVGILCDDNLLINWAVSYFKNEDNLFAEVGNIRNAVPFIHQDPDSSEQLGQCEESGRDQGHATLCVSLMGAFCQMALNVGEDLFAYDDYRALKMAEYVGKYNLVKDESWSKATNTSSANLTESDFVTVRELMPYTAYTNPSWSNPTISAADDASRGTRRPCWEVFYNYAKANNRPAAYCKKWVEQMRQFNEYGSDGGAGDYGPNSGGFDQLGYGTLMYAK